MGIDVTHRDLLAQALINKNITKLVDIFDKAQ